MTPEELRELTAKAQEASRRKAEAEARAKAKAAEQRRQTTFNRIDDWISAIERALPNAAKSGRSSYQHHLTTTTCYDDEGRANVREAAELVAAHFRQEGLRAQYRCESSTEWYRGEPGPGDDTHYVEVSWK